MTLPTATLESLRSLQTTIGAANAENGFHERTKTLRHLSQVCRNDASGGQFEGPQWDRLQATHDENLTDHIVATLALFDTETSEAIEEVRKGRGVRETYYSLGDDKDVLRLDPETGALRKPEGVPSEVADVIIRAFDFAARFDIDIAAAIDEKLAYNATRGVMHGGKKL